MLSIVNDDLVVETIPFSEARFGVLYLIASGQYTGVVAMRVWDYESVTLVSLTRSVGSMTWSDREPIQIRKPGESPGCVIPACSPTFRLSVLPNTTALVLRNQE